MAGLNFADSHNMVAYLQKSTENADFAEISDFLNANPIWYALTVSHTIYVSCIEQFWSTAKTKTVNNETQIHAKVEGKTIVISESSVRRDLQFNDEGDEAVHEERGDNVERAATTATSLDAEQDNGGRPRRQETMGDRPAQTRFESLSKQSYDSPLGGVNTPQSDEDRNELKELMEICTKLSKRVLDLETTKTAQAKKIANLKKRGKQSLIFEDSVFDEEFDDNMDEAIEQVYDANKDIVEEGEVQVPTADMEVNTASAPVTTAGVYVSTAEPITTASEVVTTAEPSIPPTTTTTTIIGDENLIIAQALMKIKSEKSKVGRVIMQEPSETATRPTIPPPQHDPKDKGKENMVEPEKPLKRKAQIKFDEEVAQRLQAQMQAELEEEERLAKQREEDANIAE
ncbi:hypothetical protein Tco_0298399 [Tanacetum coccineum]